MSYDNDGSWRKKIQLILIKAYILYVYNSLLKMNEWRHKQIKVLISIEIIITVAFESLDLEKKEKHELSLY